MLVTNVALNSLISLADKLLRYRMPTWRPISQLWIRGGNDLEECVADLVVRRDVAGIRRRRTVHRHRRHRRRWRHPRNSPRRPFFMSPSSGRVAVAFAPSNAKRFLLSHSSFRRSPEKPGIPTPSGKFYGIAKQTSEYRSTQTGKLSSHISLMRRLLVLNL